MGKDNQVSYYIAYAKRRRRLNCICAFQKHIQDLREMLLESCEIVAKKRVKIIHLDFEQVYWDDAIVTDFQEFYFSEILTTWIYYEVKKLEIKTPQKNIMDKVFVEVLFHESMYAHPINYADKIQVEFL